MWKAQSPGAVKGDEVESRQRKETHRLVNYGTFIARPNAGSGIG